jgi:hypothetical protein
MAIVRVSRRMRNRSKAVVANGVSLTAELELTAPVELGRASILYFSIFCIRFFRAVRGKIEYRQN